MTLVGRLVASGNPCEGLSLIALRSVGGDARIVAVASYMRLTDTAAEVSFAVDDRFQGKGIATLLLERLAVDAADAGFRSFLASMLADNRPMADVFRDSGFEIRSTSDAGVVQLQLTLSASADGVAISERRRQQATVASFRPLLEPRSIVVIGASRDATKMGHVCCARCRSAGTPAGSSWCIRQPPTYVAHPPSSRPAICRLASIWPSSPYRTTECFRCWTSAQPPASNP